MKAPSLIITLVLFTQALLAQIERLPIGSMIPMSDHKMKSVNGKNYSIADIKGEKGTLVIFSCNTCPYVIKYQSRTQTILKYAKENGVGIIILNSNEAYRTGEDSYEAMIKYARDQKYGNAPYVLDENSAVADAFMANRTPECFLFNAEGKLVYHGAIDSEPNNPATSNTLLMNAIEEVSEGKEVTLHESRSIGCSIKRKEN